MIRAHVILVPGFFGFGRLGKIDYFAGVGKALVRALAERGIEAQVSEVVTPPTVPKTVKVRFEAACDPQTAPADKGEAKKRMDALRVLIMNPSHPDFWTTKLEPGEHSRRQAKRMPLSVRLTRSAFGGAAWS